jgi:hypothetical protein
LSFTSPALCQVPGCGARGQHRPDCADGDACRGCAPRQAADGLRLCALHAERIAEDALEAPNLHEALGRVLIRPGSQGERTTGGATGAPVPDDAVMDARHAIRSALISLTRLVAGQRGLSTPRLRRGAHTWVDTSPAALGRYVARHALWLAAHRDAADHAMLLNAVTRGPVRRLAYPSRPDALYIGDCPLVWVDEAGAEYVCGTRLYQSAARPLVRCPGCGTDETIEQWQRWIVGDIGPVADAYAIATYLTLRWMRPDVDASLLRQWAHRGRIVPLMRPDPTPTEPDRLGPVRDERGRVLYEVAGVVAYAERIWSAPPRLSRAST